MAESVELHERVTRVEKKLAETHALAAATDKEVADYRAVPNGNTNLLKALRVTQAEQGETLASHGRRLDSLERKVDEGFARMDLRFAQVDEGFARMDLRFAQVDEGFARMDLKFAQVDEGFARMDLKFAQVDEGFARMDLKFAQVDLKFARVDEGFRLMESKFATLQAGQEQITELLTKRLDVQGGCAT